MSHAEFSKQELETLSEHDFDTYDDPTVQAIVDFERAGAEWTSRVRTLFNAATKQGRAAEAQSRLTQAAFHYADTFEVAATAIGTDKQITENAIKELSNLILIQDAMRRRRLRTCDKNVSLPPPTKQYIRELTHTYADPDNDLLPIGAQHDFDPAALAKATFLADLEDQADSVLGGLRHNQPETKQAPNQSRSRKIALRAFGPYK